MAGRFDKAIVAAAATEALDYEDDAASDALFSDGRGACDAGSCEVGRRLQETGNGSRDTIAVVRSGDPGTGRRYAAPVSQGSRLMVRLPEQPGAWAVRCRPQGNRVVARHPLAVG